MIRIIPRLDIKGPNLVKGVHLEGLRVLGKPEQFARYYYENGADELLYIDVVASLYGRNSLLPIIEKTAKEIFIPLTVGGGLRSIEDIHRVLRAGADKVAINTEAIRNPEFITKAAKVFGAQCIVVSISARLRDGGRYEALTDNGREQTGKDVLDWAREAADLGAGEILITSIDREGTGQGYDIDLVKMVAQTVSIPVIACGGAGQAEHFSKVVKDGYADAVCAASIFHYHRVKEIEKETKLNEQFQGEGNIEFIKQNRGSTDFLSRSMHPIDIVRLKKYLAGAGISCHPIENNQDLSLKVST